MVTPTQALPINYPLSKYTQSLSGHQLSYEVLSWPAMHAIDSYLDRLEALGKCKASPVWTLNIAP